MPGHYPRRGRHERRPRPRSKLEEATANIRYLLEQRAVQVGLSISALALLGLLALKADDLIKHIRPSDLPITPTPKGLMTSLPVHTIPPNTRTPTPTPSRTPIPSIQTPIPTPSGTPGSPEPARNTYEPFNLTEEQIDLLNERGLISLDEQNIPDNIEWIEFGPDSESNIPFSIGGRAIFGFDKVIEQGELILGGFWPDSNKDWFIQIGNFPDDLTWEGNIAALVYRDSPNEEAIRLLDLPSTATFLAQTGEGQIVAFGYQRLEDGSLGFRMLSEIDN